MLANLATIKMNGLRTFEYKTCEESNNNGGGGNDLGEDNNYEPEIVNIEVSVFKTLSGDGFMLYAEADAPSNKNLCTPRAGYADAEHKIVHYYYSCPRVTNVLGTRDLGIHFSYDTNTQSAPVEFRYGSQSEYWNAHNPDTDRMLGFTPQKEKTLQQFYSWTYYKYSDMKLEAQKYHSEPYLYIGTYCTGDVDTAYDKYTYDALVCSDSTNNVDYYIRLKNGNIHNRLTMFASDANWANAPTCANYSWCSEYGY